MGLGACARVEVVSNGQTDPAEKKTRDPYEVMRPKRGSAVAIVLGVLVLAAFAYGAITVPGRDGQKDDWGLGDRAALLLIGVGVAWFLWRFATIRAVPSREGIAVRNLLLSRELTWAEVVRVQFGGGAPWARLDISDGDTVAVMAIQKADGPYAAALASRLAALVQVHSAGTEPGRPAPPPASP